MSLTFRIMQRVEADPARVFTALTNAREAHSWMPGLVRLDRIEEEEDVPLHVGSRFRETRMLFGKEATEEFEVTELTPPSRIGLLVDGRRGSSRRGEYVFTYTLAPEHDGTLVTLDGEVRDLGPVMGLFARLFVGTYRKACAKDLEALSGYFRRARNRGARRTPVS